METILEKADFLIRLLLFSVVVTIWMFIGVAPFYASRHEQSGQESKDAPKKGGEDHANEEDKV